MRSRLLAFSEHFPSIYVSTLGANLISRRHIHSFPPCFVSASKSDCGRCFLLGFRTNPHKRHPFPFILRTGTPVKDTFFPKYKRENGRAKDASQEFNFSSRNVQGGYSINTTYSHDAVQRTAGMFFGQACQKGVLVVDEQGIRKVVRIALEKLGYYVVEAKDGQ